MWKLGIFPRVLVVSCFAALQTAPYNAEPRLTADGERTRVVPLATVFSPSQRVTLQKIKEYCMKDLRGLFLGNTVRIVSAKPSLHGKTNGYVDDTAEPSYEIFAQGDKVGSFNAPELALEWKGFNDTIKNCTEQGLSTIDQTSLEAAKKKCISGMGRPFEILSRLKSTGPAFSQMWFGERWQFYQFTEDCGSAVAEASLLSQMNRTMLEIQRNNCIDTLNPLVITFSSHVAGVARNADREYRRILDSLIRPYEDQLFATHKEAVDVDVWDTNLQLGKFDQMITNCTELNASHDAWLKIFRPMFEAARYKCIIDINWLRKAISTKWPSAMESGSNIDSTKILNDDMRQIDYNLSTYKKKVQELVLSDEGPHEHHFNEVIAKCNKLVADASGLLKINRTILEKERKDCINNLNALSNDFDSYYKPLALGLDVEVRSINTTVGLSSPINRLPFGLTELHRPQTIKNEIMKFAEDRLPALQKKVLETNVSKADLQLAEFDEMIIRCAELKEEVAEFTPQLFKATENNCVANIDRLVEEISTKYQSATVRELDEESRKIMNNDMVPLNYKLEVFAEEIKKIDDPKTHSDLEKFKEVMEECTKLVINGYKSSIFTGSYLN